MGWIKRHLILAIGGIIALLLIGLGTWYLMENINRNSTAEAGLEEKKHSLEELYNQDPFPNRTNIDSAKKETAKIRTIITQARQSFTPVPYANVTGLEFKQLLDNTIYELHTKAEKASVVLPTKSYEFSFAAQKKGLKLSPRSFPGVNIQLAEVKTICHILFDAKINRLVNLRRVRLSEDDPPGLDYLDNRTNKVDDITGAVLSPYQIEFQCFSSELAAAIEGLYKSPHGLLVKGLMVEAMPDQPKAPQAAQPAPVNLVPNLRGTNRFPRPLNPNPAVPKDGLETILNEKPLKVLLLVEVVKPAAGK